MRAALVAATLAACRAAGSGAVATPPAAPPPASVTCGDAGAILRGRVEDSRRAGPEKEAAIASACMHGAWAAEVLRCIGTQPHARACLDALTEDQRTAYDRKLVAWNEKFPDEMLEDGDGERLDGDAPDDDVPCTEAVHDVEQLAPPIAATGDDRDLGVALREPALISLCDDGWSPEARACFRDAKGGSGNFEPCRALLEADQQKAIADKLAALDQLAARIAAIKKKPASFECRQVAAVHYADAAWKGKLPALVGARRPQVIAESRTRMIKSCIESKWSANARACFVAGGGDSCFAVQQTFGWGFPAAGVVMKSGIAECDAYGAAVGKLDACDKLPPLTRDSLRESFTRQNERWLNVPVDARKTTAAACKAGEESIRQIAGSVGCKL
jgi:hypothetical protein